MYKAIIFDFFGVFCADLSMNWFTKAVPNHHDLLERFHEICKKSDLGLITKTEFHNEMSVLTGIPIQEVIEGIKAEEVLNLPVVNLARSLKNNYKLALLSNATDEWIDQILHDAHMTDLFEVKVISASVGFAKPDKEIFDFTLDRLGLQADEVIFIDDRAKNTEASTRYGIKSILFKDVIDLKSQLNKLSDKFQ